MLERSRREGFPARCPALSSAKEIMCSDPFPVMAQDNPKIPSIRYWFASGLTVFSETIWSYRSCGSSPQL